ncbi:hypothetical protein NDU88_001845 [Pleurodeles waltl]|uniref:Uncharacterized protein n=1 Tax=Pleurodeles waltl TaxID=8319 RepID=A0AAV7Q5H6_PLEWA|nr:hypothetical protein NDU88_001845 [Pleurodeles waltl]
MDTGDIEQALDINGARETVFIKSSCCSDVDQCILDVDKCSVSFEGVTFLNGGGCLNVNNCYLLGINSDAEQSLDSDVAGDKCLYIDRILYGDVCLDVEWRVYSKTTLDIDLNANSEQTGILSDFNILPLYVDWG